MTYRIVLHPKAEAELEEAYRFIFDDSPENAARWRRSLLKKAKTLKSFPERCPLAPESELLDEDVRQLLYGVYRPHSPWRSPGTGRPARAVNSRYGERTDHVLPTRPRRHA